MNHLSPTPGQILTGAAYIRVSTEDQIEYSPDSQLKKIREYADAKNILLPDEFIYLDEGISGRSAHKRPAFMHMIAAAKSKPRPFDIILLWKYSRFARNRQDSIFYKSMLRKDCGIEVVSITEQLSGDPTSILIEALLEAMDEYYSINLAQEVKRGMNEKFSRGGVISSPPFGYRMGANHFEPDAFTAPWVPLIYKKFLAGASMRDLAHFLNSMEICTKRGRRFEPRAVRYILSNPVYLGFLRKQDPAIPGGNTYALVRGFHSPLVTEPLFLAVQDRLRTFEGCHIKKCTSEPAGFMLRGLVRCSRCGAALSRTAGGRALQCHRYAKGQCKESHYISLDALNQAVLKQMERDFSMFSAGCSVPEIPIKIQNSRAAAPQDAQEGCSVPALPRLIQNEKARISRIKRAYEEGIDSLEEYRKQKAQIEARIRCLKEELSIETIAETDTASDDTYVISMSGLMKALRSDSVTEAAKNEILRCLICEIIFWGPERNFRICYRGI